MRVSLAFAVLLVACGGAESTGATADESQEERAVVADAPEAAGSEDETDR